MKKKHLEESFNKQLKTNNKINPINTLFLNNKSIKYYNYTKKDNKSSINIHKYKSIIKEKNIINKKLTPSSLHKTKTCSFFSLNKKIANLNIKLEKNYINVFKNGSHYKSVVGTNNINKQKYKYKNNFKNIDSIFSPKIKSKIMRIYKSLDNFHNSKTYYSFNNLNSEKTNNKKINNKYDDILHCNKAKYINNYNKLIKNSINNDSLNLENNYFDKNQIIKSLSKRMSLKKKIKYEKMKNYSDKNNDNKNEKINFNMKSIKENKEYNDIITDINKVKNNKHIQISINNEKESNDKDIKKNSDLNNFLNKYKGNQKKIMEECIKKLNYNYSDDHYNYNYKINYNEIDTYNNNQKI